ncbi:MAG: hypothetical protein ACFCD0_00130 [Gemmataceae bacterium]
MNAWTHVFITIACCLILFPQAQAQQSWQFRWEPGQVLKYRVHHKTLVVEKLGESSVKASANLQLIKQWKIVAVDKQGVATVQFSLEWMRNEQQFPDGKTWLFDSKQLDKSTPSLKGMSKMIGIPLAVLRVAPSGEVIKADKGSLKRYQSEPPFQIVFSQKSVKLGESWEREYKLQTNPRGESASYPAVQTYTYKNSKKGLATFRLKTVFNKVPDNPFDQIPLLQKQPQGTVTFNTKAGRLEQVTLNISKELENHQGKNTRYMFQSEYTERYVGD